MVGGKRCGANQRSENLTGQSLVQFTHYSHLEQVLESISSRPCQLTTGAVLCKDCSFTKEDCCVTQKATRLQKWDTVHLKPYNDGGQVGTRINATRLKPSQQPLQTRYKDMAIGPVWWIVCQYSP